MIRCLRRSLHNKITVQKLALTTKVSSCLTSVTEKFGKERFKYHWLVVQGQKVLIWECPGPSALSVGDAI